MDIEAYHDFDHYKKEIENDADHKSRIDTRECGRMVMVVMMIVCHDLEDVFQVVNAQMPRHSIALCILYTDRHPEM